MVPWKRDTSKIIHAFLFLCVHIKWVNLWNSAGYSLFQCWNKLNRYVVNDKIWSVVYSRFLLWKKVSVFSALTTPATFLACPGCCRFRSHSLSIVLAGAEFGGGSACIGMAVTAGQQSSYVEPDWQLGMQPSEEGALDIKIFSSRKQTPLFRTIFTMMGCLIETVVSCLILCWHF